MESRKEPAKETQRLHTATGKPYHHGNLRDALVSEALSLAAESGIDAVTVRETARRAGVSPGAPFRHFADKTALMTAVAEEAMGRFEKEIDAALAGVGKGDPVAGVRALGRAFLTWAIRNPTHFEIISARRSIAFDNSAYLVGQNRRIQALFEEMLAKARDQGKLRFTDTRLIQLTARALVYGLARMLIDGHMPSWNVNEAEAEPAMEAALDLFLAGLFKE